MALVTCKECSKEMSDAAEACPACGAPNKKVKAKTKDSKQAMGCLLVLLAIPLSLVITPIGGVLVAVVGILMMLLNTRLR
jgi:uncharacterized membrane protein